MEAVLEHPTAGTTKNIGLAAKLYGTPGRITKPAPLLAQHTREVLLRAGYTADEIDALGESGAAVINDI
jgi:crotonobetainyl-CoA:carnitine CoA-transferase CaiB-like acyl-CoA transferase